jgi:hypothetical protein
LQQSLAEDDPTWLLGFFDTIIGDYPVFQDWSAKAGGGLWSEEVIKGCTERLMMLEVRAG